ncbi:MAG: dethiobiotin synthase [Planctomycetota bacterium]
MILFVTGTDTGVGKTVIAGALAIAARAAGKRVAALKPVETGCAGDPPVAADAELLASCAGASAEDVVMWKLRAPLAPAVAAFAEQTELSLDRIAEKVSSLAALSDIVIVEGAGGLRVPITWAEDYLDLAVRLGAEVVLVARAGLGTINHTRLTLDALRRRDVPVRGVVLNASSPPVGPYDHRVYSSNLDVLRHLAPLERFEAVPYIEGGASSRCLRVAELVTWLLE